MSNHWNQLTETRLWWRSILRQQNKNVSAKETVSGCFVLGNFLRRSCPEITMEWNAHSVLIVATNFSVKFRRKVSVYNNNNNKNKVGRCLFSLLRKDQMYGLSQLSQKLFKWKPQRSSLQTSKFAFIAGSFFFVFFFSMFGCSPPWSTLSKLQKQNFRVVKLSYSLRRRAHAQNVNFFVFVL